VSIERWRNSLDLKIMDWLTFSARLSRQIPACLGQPYTGWGGQFELSTPGARFCSGSVTALA